MWTRLQLAACSCACARPDRLRRRGACRCQTPKAAAPLQLVAEDLLLLDTQSLAQGPVISGSLQPELRADLRAEVAGVVLEVLKDNGDAVAKGDLLIRLDPTAIRDKLLSAQEADRAAVGGDGSVRAPARSACSRWRAGDLVATEALENAEAKRNQAQADLASARARVVEARQQTGENRGARPLSHGVVGARAVSAGDTAQVGKELLTVLDVATMRFRGQHRCRSGRSRASPVRRWAFASTAIQTAVSMVEVQRVNPVADAATRQVQVLVSLPKTDVTWVAGLYAEGRIDVASRLALLVPESAVVNEGDTHSVWLVQDGVLHKINIQLGERDERLGRHEVLSGLSVGAQILRHPVGAVKEGVAIRMASDIAASTTPAVQTGN
jgi:membrane fusion protein (multidrug efflux system)